MRRAVRDLGILYLILLILLWGFLRLECDHFWLATVLEFSPLWALFTPMLILIPWTMAVRWWGVGFYLVPAAVILFPIMGWEFPLHRASDATALRIKVITCNAGGMNKVNSMVEFIQQQEIDVVFLQECEAERAKLICNKLNWNFRHDSQVAIASKHPLGPMTILARFDEEHYRAAAAIVCSVSLRATRGTDSPVAERRINLVSVHLPTPRPGIQRLLDEGPAGIDAIQKVNHYRAELSHEIATKIDELDGETILGGDFNMPEVSRIYQKDWSHRFNAFTDSGTGFGFTKRTRFHGIRIDHILTDRHWRACRAYVGPPHGGDHRPMVAELVAISQEPSSVTERRP